MENQEKIDKIAFHFAEIMKVMGLDLEDPSLQNTPNRVGKMYVNEIFSGLDPAKKPAITFFPNDKAYSQMVIETGITVRSMCEHHFVPILGVAHIAYIPGDKVIGLSKFHRIVEYYSSRPQVQERLTNEIAECLKEALGHDNVAVVIVAEHYCVKLRGVKDANSLTTTSAISGAFETMEARSEFLRLIDNARLSK